MVQQLKVVAESRDSLSDIMGVVLQAKPQQFDSLQTPNAAPTFQRYRDNIDQAAQVLEEILASSVVQPPSMHNVERRTLVDQKALGELPVFSDREEDSFV